MTAKPLGSLVAQNAKIVNLTSNKELLEDARLIDLCLGNDRLAQSAFYKRWFNRVLAICLRYTTDRAEAKHMVNTTFLKVFKNLDKLNAPQVFGGWVKRIAINSCIDHIRAKNKIKLVAPEHIPETGIESDVVSRLSAADILASLQKVSPVSRIVFSMYVIDGYKHKEIAEKLGIQIGTSRWHLSNAKKEMKELLKNY